MRTSGAGGNAVKTGVYATRIVSIFLSAFLFGIVNYIDVRRPVTCDDCSFPYGLPFPFFHEGGYAGGRGIVWTGTVGDIIIVLLIGQFFTVLWRWFSHRHRISSAF